VRNNALHTGPKNSSERETDSGTEWPQVPNTRIPLMISELFAIYTNTETQQRNR